VLTEAHKERLALAQRLRESADRSEQELRNALSRSYYSIYHAARAWVGSERGGLGHGELQAKVRERDPELANTIRELYILREKADYDPEMVGREDKGDIERFRRRVNEALERSRAAYEAIRKKIEGVSR
jgi:hypothetical protein